MRKILLALLALACGPALAQDTGWYVGGGIGSAKADFVRGDFTSLAPGAVYSADDDDFAESVRRDLDSLPTTEEPRSKRP